MNRIAGPKSRPEVGRVVTPATIENYFDLESAAEGRIPAVEVRSVAVADALVDTGATQLSMPGTLIRALGLRPVRVAKARTAAGLLPLSVYSTVRLTIQGRSCLSEVTEVPEGSPVLIGQVPLELLDLVPFPRRQALRPNPEHGDERIMEVL